MKGNLFENQTLLVILYLYIIRWNFTELEFIGNKYLIILSERERVYRIYSYTGFFFHSIRPRTCV